jgi:thymidylate synthase
MIHVFDGDTADEVWTQAAAAVDSTSDAERQPSRIGDTVELLHTLISIRNPRQRWVLSRQPAINPAFAIAEVVWILAGRNDAAFLNHWNPALPRYAGARAVYHGAYGYRLRKNLGVDQLERAFATLRANPASRQVVLQIWDSKLDLPEKNGQPRDPDIPCNICSMLKVRNGRLDWMQVLRSNDLFLGVPHNIVQFTFLQEVMAGWLGIEMGSYHQLSDSLHVYERDIAQMRRYMPASSIRSHNSFMLEKRDSDRAWSELERRMSNLVEIPYMSKSEWKTVGSGLDVPQAFLDLWTVVAADDARRRGWEEEAESEMSSCSDPALRLAWSGWLERKKGLNLLQ